MGISSSLNAAKMGVAKAKQTTLPGIDPLHSARGANRTETKPLEGLLHLSR
jgi:hypothetical protein